MTNVETIMFADQTVNVADLTSKLIDNEGDNDTPIDDDGSTPYPITPDEGDNPYPIPFHDISLWAEEYDLDLIELPWVADQTEVLTLDPLESLEGLLSLEDSVELDMSGYSGDPDDTVNTITVKTNTEAMPFYTETDWKTILEDWMLSSELG
jgi:hypothetical protein